MITDDHWINTSQMPKGWQAWPGYAGADFGYNAPHAQVYGAHDAVSDILYIFDEYYATERTNAQNAREAPHREQVTMAWGDPAAPEAIAEFVHQRWRMTACPRHEVVEGLKEVFERLATGRLFFVRGRLTELSKEQDSYVWDAEHPDKVIKMNDHGSDALQYLCWGLKSSGRSLPDQAFSPGRMGGWKLEDPGIPESAVSGGSTARMYLGTRQGLRSRLAGLPRRFTGSR